MSKLRLISEYHQRKKQKAILSHDIKRKSASLHDLSSDTKSDTLLCNTGANMSILTLDSVPTGDSGLISRTTSHLSLPAASTRSFTPSLSEIDLKLRNEKLEAKLKEKDKALIRINRMYKALFLENQNLKLKYAEYQNQVDRFRLQVYSNPSNNKLVDATYWNNNEHDSTSQHNFMKRSHTSHGFYSIESADNVDIQEDSSLDDSPSEHADSISSSSAIITSSCSDDEAIIKPLYPLKQEATGWTPSIVQQTFTPVHKQSKLVRRRPKNQTSPHSSGLESSLRRKHSPTRQEIVETPGTPDSWVLDKAMVEGLDPEISDYEEDSNTTLHTNDTSSSSAKSDETLLAQEEIDESNLSTPHLSAFRIPDDTTFKKHNMLQGTSLQDFSSCEPVREESKLVQRHRPTYQSPVSSREVTPQPRRKLSQVSRQEIVVSPVSSGMWTLDKSIQLVSDSEMSEVGEELKKTSLINGSVLTGARSEETLLGDVDDSYVPRESLSDFHIPEVTPKKKVENWQSIHWGKKEVETSTWSPCLRVRPKSLVELSHANYRSPMALLSPRPFQRVTTPDHYSAGPPIVPPLNLSALISEPSIEEHQQISIATTPSQTEICNRGTLNRALKKAESNLDLSCAILKHLKTETYL